MNESGKPNNLNPNNWLERNWETSTEQGGEESTIPIDFVEPQRFIESAKVLGYQSFYEFLRKHDERVKKKQRELSFGAVNGLSDLRRHALKSRYLAEVYLIHLDSFCETVQEPSLINGTKEETDKIISLLGKFKSGLTNNFRYFFNAAEHSDISRRLLADNLNFAYRIAEVDEKEKFGNMMERLGIDYESEMFNDPRKANFAEFVFRHQSANYSRQVERLKELGPVSSVAAWLLANQHTEIRATAIPMVSDYLQKFNIKFGDVDRCWNAALTGKYRADAVVRNLSRLNQLEGQEEETVAFLHKKFGLKSFGRVPVETYEACRKGLLEGKYNRHAYWFNESDDWNNGFFSTESDLGYLTSQLKSKDCFIIPIEFNNRRSIGRGLVNASWILKKKGDFLVFIGHGDDDSIELSLDHEIKAFDKTDVDNIIKREYLDQFLNPSAEVAVLSCKGYNLAKHAAEQSEMKFYGHPDNLDTNKRVISAFQAKDKRVGIHVYFNPGE